MLPGVSVYIAGVVQGPAECVCVCVCVCVCDTHQLCVTSCHYPAVSSLPT